MSKSAFEKLNDKYKLFVSEYIQDMNGTRAATECKYANPDVMAVKLLKRKDIQAAIKEILQPIMDKNELTADSVLKQLHAFLFRSIKDFVGPDGFLITNVSDLPSTVAQCVEGWDVESIEEWDEESQSRVVVGQKVKVRLASKIKSLELSMKHLKLLQPDSATFNQFNIGFDWGKFFKGQEEPVAIIDPVEARIAKEKNDTGRSR